MTDLPAKVDILGTGVSAVSLAEATERILNAPEQGLVVAVANVHSVMSARGSEELAQTLGRADLVTPDGMPLVWAHRALGVEAPERVDGLRLFRSTVEAGLPAGARHYFYGSSPEILALMDGEEPAVARAVRLGMPKQELWMDQVRVELPGMSLVGVGAVFDWVAGTVSKAPTWMQNAGLEWLYRLAQDPRRLWRRYAYNNPAFLVLLTRQVLRDRLTRRSASHR